MQVYLRQEAIKFTQLKMNKGWRTKTGKRAKSQREKLKVTLMGDNQRRELNSSKEKENLMVAADPNKN